MPVESILDATFTVLPQMSYRSLVVPITPAVTSPQWAPIRSLNLDKFIFVSQIRLSPNLLHTPYNVLHTKFKIKKKILILFYFT